MTIDDSVLLAYVDGELPPDRRLAVEAAVAHSDDLAGRLAAMRASALPYGAAFARQQLPEIPASLSQRINELARVSASSRSVRRAPQTWLRIAAAFALGAVCTGVALQVAPGGAPLIADAGAVAAWVRAVADYQTLYSRETLVNVNEDPAQTSKVIGDLQAKDGMDVQVPDLRGAGMTFKRVQRLSFHGRPVVQMVYLPEHGGPLALCVTKDPGADAQPRAQPVGDMQTVTWRHKQLAYVLLAKESPAELGQIAHQLAGTL